MGNSGWRSASWIVTPVLGGRRNSSGALTGAAAAAAPGGFVFVSRGMIRCCESEDALAAVLAHEIAHVRWQHGLGQALFMGAKLWILLFPLVWRWRVERQPLSLSPARQGGEQQRAVGQRLVAGGAEPADDSSARSIFARLPK